MIMQIIGHIECLGDTVELLDRRHPAGFKVNGILVNGYLQEGGHIAFK
jgi:hypothetical protein